MLKKENRLKKRKEFNYIYKKGTIIHSSSFIIHFVRAFRSYPQIGISVSKTVGNSVVRSRVKRIISEACRLNIEKFAIKNYVITAKESAKEKGDFHTRKGRGDCRIPRRVPYQLSQRLGEHYVRL